MEMFEKKIHSDEKFCGRIFRVTDDDVELADGSRSKREIVWHGGGVCCAGFNERDEIAFVRQYRYAYGAVLTELPAGKLEKGEDPFEAIKREMSEETGARCDEWQSLGVMYPTPGYCTEVIHLYTCRISSVGEQHPDEDERLEVVYIPFDEAVRMVLSGELPDAKTQVIILRLAMQRSR